MFERDGENDFSQLPRPEYEFPNDEFKSFIDKRAELLESVGLAIFDPEQTQWRRDVAKQTEELLKAFRQVVVQIFDGAESPAEFALKTTEFMVGDRIIRTNYINHLKKEIAIATFTKIELNDSILQMYYANIRPVLIANIQLLFQQALESDIQQALPASHGPDLP